MARWTSKFHCAEYGSLKLGSTPITGQGAAGLHVTPTPLGNIGLPLQLKAPHCVVVGGLQRWPSCTEVKLALSAVPVVLMPRLGKFAPQGFDGENVVTGFRFVRTA